MSKDETAVKDEVLADDAALESAPEEQLSEVELEDVDVDAYDAEDEHQPTAVNPTKEAPKDDVADDTAEPTEEAKTEEAPRGKEAEKRNQQLDSEIAAEKDRLGIDPSVEIRSKVDLRNYLRELEDINQAQARLANEQELLNQISPTGDYYTPSEVQRIAYQQSIADQQQQLQQRQYEVQVETNRATIDQDSATILKDMPIFNPDSTDYKPQIAEQAAQLLEANLIRDPNVPELDAQGQPTGKGLIVGANALPSQIYRTVFNAYQASLTEGQIKGQQATERMLAEADVTPSSSQAKVKSKDDELFDEYDVAV